MTLEDSVWATLQRLADHGWRELLAAHDFDLDEYNFGAEALRPLAQIDRELEGFQDFAEDATRAIEPGRPSHSLLYHALASPHVRTRPDGSPLGAFPTPAELEAVENWIYGIRAPSITAIRQRYPGNELAVAVFALEYRPATGTAHGRHADLAFSRTGISRVGTDRAAYDGIERCFQPITDGDGPHTIRVLPCRYAAYVAVKLKGDPARFGPRHFNRGQTTRQAAGGDEDADFWVPVHKLFTGSECLAGIDLEVKLRGHHLNQKIGRIHDANMGQSRTGFSSGWDLPDTDNPPFRFSEGIAEFSNDDVLGRNHLMPVVHASLVEKGQYQDRGLAMRVPAAPANNLSPSFLIPKRDVDSDVFRSGARGAPEWMHVRTELDENGGESDLNAHEDVAKLVRGGVDQALHYVDFAGDGWIVAEVTGLRGRLNRSVQAYSIVAAPDFYPYVNQSDIMDWWVSELPRALQRTLWGRPPYSLSDQRVAANLALLDHGATFESDDTTVTAIVSQDFDRSPAAARALNGHPSGKLRRVGVLPDSAAGFYAPGWDTSLDFNDEKRAWHLAAHGLGSPFPEDAKLCAAISAFWPAVAPDSARQYGPGRWRSVVPMTDVEIGLGEAPGWDGVGGPRVVRINNQDWVEYPSFDHADYVRQALAGRFSLAETARVDFDEYTARARSTNKVLQFFGFRDSPNNFGQLGIISFRKVDRPDPLLDEAEAALGALAGEVYFFDMFKSDTSERRQAGEADWREQYRISGRGTFFVGDGPRILVRIGQGDWQAATVI